MLIMQKCDKDGTRIFVILFCYSTWVFNNMLRGSKDIFEKLWVLEKIAQRKNSLRL